MILLILDYIKAFAVGGLLCLIGQVLIDKTRLTLAKILTSYVVIGVLLGAVGVYQPLVQWAGAGASIPLTGFGNLLAQGIKKAISEKGVLGIMTGGLTSAAAGVCAAVFFAYLIALIFKPKEKV